MNWFLYDNGLRHERLKEFWIAGRLMTEAVVRRCSVEKVFLEISQNLQEKTCARAST